MKRKITAITFICFFVFPTLTFAGEYIITKGKGVEVCEEYGKNLNSFKPKIPMRYERKINPEFKDFSKPKWEKIYFHTEGSQELFDKIDLFLWEKDADPSYHNFVREGKNLSNTQKQRTEAWERYKANRQSRLSLGLPIGRIDIDNDGKIENVSFDGRVGGVYGEILIVLSDDKTDIDLKKTALLLQHSSLPADVEANIYDLVYYDVFIYKNKAYHDLWKKSDPLRSVLTIFITENQNTQELCTYQYR